jgi:hypothetical protein
MTLKSCIAAVSESRMNRITPIARSLVRVGRRVVFAPCVQASTTCRARARELPSVER